MNKSTELWFARYHICAGEKNPQETEVKDLRIAQSRPGKIKFITSDFLNAQKFTYREFIRTHLFKFVIILWESLLFVRILLNFLFFSLLESSLVYDHSCESIFLSLYENQLVYESHYLKQMFYHQNTITIFFDVVCSNFMFFNFEFFSFYVWLLFY